MKIYRTATGPNQDTFLDEQAAIAVEMSDGTIFTIRDNYVASTIEGQGPGFKGMRISLISGDKLAILPRDKNAFIVEALEKPYVKQ